MQYVCISLEFRFLLQSEPSWHWHHMLFQIPFSKKKMKKKVGNSYTFFASIFLNIKNLFCFSLFHSMAEHFGLLFLIVGLCLFIAFIIWIMFFMKVHEEIEEALEDGGEIYIITGSNEDNIKNQDILLERPRSRFPWHLQ